MVRLLEAKSPLPALRLMIETGVLGEVVPGPVVLERLARLIELAPKSDALVRLAALLRPPPADPTAAATVIDRWRMSNRDAERLLALAADPLPDLWASPAERARDLHRLGTERYADLVRIAAADSGHSDAAPAAAGREPAALAAALAAAKAWQPKRLPVGGNDILALGVPPGPRVGALLAALEAWWIGHDFAPDRAACLAEARRLVARDGVGDGTAAPGPQDSTIA
jgi:poly(A) polymerase